ncbi:MAG: hypothetical protein JNM81_05080 [Rhodospirillaceae bacterium]|nr:hypothetical protein [Rhodospirillaceae bacterium]
MARTLTGGGFLWRWLVALVIVLGTFNPTPYSYINWVFDAEGALPLKVLIGIVLLIALVVYLRATWFSIGPLGLILSAAFFAALIWVLVDYGVLALGQGSLLTWIILVVISLILAIGMSFSLFRRGVSGQVDVDDVET